MSTREGRGERGEGRGRGGEGEGWRRERNTVSSKTGLLIQPICHSDSIVSVVNVYRKS